MKKIVLVLGFIFPLCVHAQTSGYCGPKDDDGNWGTNCEWVYDEASKTLTISGQGNMYTTPSTHDHPWSKGSSFFNDIENVVIENGITYIGGHAFYGAKSLKNITMPDTLTTIGWNAFNGGTKLTSIVIPDSVTYIGGDDNHDPFIQSVTSVYCSPNQQEMCQKAIEWSDLDTSKVLKIYEKYGDKYYVDGKFYEKPQDIGTTNYIKKRIYTIDEANKVAGKKNSVGIRYK